MTRFAFTIEYDGRPFMGWQHQDHGPSVQQAIEGALHGITREAALVHAAGRTDAGVHATGMRAHTEIEKEIGAFRLMEALNAHLRSVPVAILSCEIVPGDWHARFSCVARHYVYRIVNRRAPLTYDQGLKWRVPAALDAAAMDEAAQILVGLHDFTTFRSAHCQSASPVKTLDRLDVVREGDEVRVYASARSFLHHQVRSMVGCLQMVGRGQWSANDLADALAAKDRARLGFNAPPDGLYFVRADYP